MFNKIIILKEAQWLKQKRLSFKIGLTLGFVHLLISLLIGYNIIVWSQNGQWQFLWSIPFTIDFPISIIYIAVFYIPFREFSYSILPYPISEFRGFILPFLLHSIIGTLWYFFLPLLIAKINSMIRRRIRRS